jgi:tetratricopeptide (TPR) repeat protein
MLLLFLAISACGQIPRITIPLPNTDPLTSVVNLGGDEPVSTSFVDAKNEVVLPDSFSPPMFKPLLTQPLGPGGGFVLGRGGYEAVLHSFCLHAGTHGPSQGDGYLYAPLKGSKAPIILTLLRASASHPEVSQQDVQSLIWAVEARAKISDLNPKLQKAAFTLLTVKQIYDLNGGALGLVPQAVMDRALAAVPPEARRLYEIQAALRQKLSAPDASFADIERIAVLAGSADQDGPVVPSGRWSAHPGGFFVRYLPNGYSETKVQIYVPGRPASSSLSRAQAAGVGDASGGSGSSSETETPATEYDPTNDVAVPANTGAQRLGLSAVPSDSDPSKSCQTLTQTDDRYQRYDEPQGSPCEELAKEAKIANARFDALDVIMKKAYDAWLNAFDARSDARKALGECQDMYGLGSSKCAKQSKGYDQAMENFNRADALFEQARAAAEKAREEFKEALDRYIECKKKQDPNYKPPPLNCS